MDEEQTESLIYASENVDSILLLSKMAENAIENDFFEKPWDLYLLFAVMKDLSKNARSRLQQIND